MLKKRSDVLVAFKNYKRKVENETGHRIKKLRTDNGKEYLSNQFKDFLIEEGISRQLTVEYTPQQNGVAERANRTLVEMTRCIMLEGNLPNSLWAEALNTATFLRNRSATRCLNNMTPFEAWSGQKPYVGFFRTIGSSVIALNKSRKGDKFQVKGEEYILVGYSQEAKAYRLWKPGTKEIIKARDVKFIEKIQTSENMHKINKLPEEMIKSTEFRFQLLNDIQQPNVDQEDDDQEDDRQDDGNDQQEQEDSELLRPPGRPHYERTGKRGRPRKIYQTRNPQQSNPESASEIFERDDTEA